MKDFRIWRVKAGRDEGEEEMVLGRVRKVLGVLGVSCRVLGDGLAGLSGCFVEGFGGDQGKPGA